MRVFVYFNLHKLLWSVRALEGPSKGRVIEHAREVYLVGCHFRVSEAGRQRVLRERRKNVHAGVVGRLAGAAPVTAREGTRVSYNPYNHPTFVRAGSAEPVHRADAVFLCERAAYAIGLAEPATPPRRSIRPAPARTVEEPGPCRRSTPAR